MGPLDVKPARRTAHPALGQNKRSVLEHLIGDLDGPRLAAAGALSQSFHILSPIILCPNRTRKEVS